MKISKIKLSKSGKKYYRFFYKDIEPQLSFVNGNFIERPHSMLEDSIFFAEEKHIIKWIDHGDILAEVLFDSSHPLFEKLPNTYFVTNDIYCGKAIILGKFIQLNQFEMSKFIIEHFDFNKSTNHLQHHLIKNKAYDTLEQIWKHKYDILGAHDKNNDLLEAIALIKAEFLPNCTLEQKSKYLNCNDWDTLKRFFN